MARGSLSLFFFFPHYMYRQPSSLARQSNSQQHPHDEQVNSMAHLWTLLTHLHSLAGPTITLLYPLYASIQALESPSKLDDEQWLAYWILYSFLTLTEMAAESILYWIPFWYEIKLVLVAWMVLPQCRGAAFVYDKFVREQLRKYEQAGGGGSPSSPSKDKVKGGKKSSGDTKKKDKSKNKFLAFVTSKKAGQEAY